MPIADPHAKPLPPGTVALNAMALPGAAGAALPEWLELVPAGLAVGRDGRQFVNDNPQAVIERHASRRLPLVVDFEHATELGAKFGEPAPAAGWVESFEIRDGAIWGRVDWTEDGARAINTRAYRFYSPALEIDKADPPHVVGLLSAGLTNNPNLFVSALNHQQPPETAMLDAAIRQALGLQDEATADDAVAAINGLKAERETALNSAKTPSLEKYVPRADYDLALNRATAAEQTVADLRQAEADAAIDAAIEAALEAKKITPATVDYHRAQCATDGGLARFQAYVEQAPAIAADSELGKGKPKQASALNAEQAHIAKLLGKPAEIFTQASA